MSLIFTPTVRHLFAYWYTCPLHPLIRPVNKKNGKEESSAISPECVESTGFSNSTRAAIITHDCGKVRIWFTYSYHALFFFKHQTIYWKRRTLMHVHIIYWTPGVRLYFTAARWEVKPLEVSRNNIFRGVLLSYPLKRKTKVAKYLSSLIQKLNDIVWIFPH